MTKASFFIDCVNDIFSLMVTGNLYIENYFHTSEVDFYKNLFEVYKDLSKFYDKVSSNEKLTEEEVESHLKTAINITREKTIRQFLDSFNERLRKKSIDYDIKKEFINLCKTSKNNDDIINVYNTLLSNLRAFEETNL